MSRVFPEIPRSIYDKQHMKRKNMFLPLNQKYRSSKYVKMATTRKINAIGSYIIFLILASVFTKDVYGAKVKLREKSNPSDTAQKAISTRTFLDDIKACEGGHVEVKVPGRQDKVLDRASYPRLNIFGGSTRQLSK